MAFDMFLEFQNAVATPSGTIKVEGESGDKAHPKSIPLASVSLGVENTTSIGSASGGVGAGKAKLDAIAITKSIDSTTPYLYSLVGTGGHFSDAALYIRKSGAPNDYLIYRFKMVFVTDIKWSAANGDDAPQETVKLVCGSMQVEYTPLSPTGVAQKAILTVWNQVTNSATADVPGN